MLHISELLADTCDFPMKCCAIPLGGKPSEGLQAEVMPGVMCTAPGLWLGIWMEKGPAYAFKKKKKYLLKFN